MVVEIVSNFLLAANDYLSVLANDGHIQNIVSWLGKAFVIAMTKLFHEVLVGISKSATAYNFWVPFHIFHQSNEGNCSLIPIHQPSDAQRHVCHIHRRHPVVKSAPDLETGIRFDEFGYFSIDETSERQTSYLLFN